MAAKKSYRVSNWSSYNRSLIERGSLTIWFNETAIEKWNAIDKTGKRGRPGTYSDIAIETALSLRAIFKLPLRATQGLVGSMITLMNLPLKNPDYSTLCRRQLSLEVQLPRTHSGQSLHVVVDATGLKIFGEGEWKVRQHGYSKRRTWRKLHLAIDEGSSEILVSIFTEADGGDGEQLPEMLNSIEEPIAQVSGDGAYDSWDNHEAIAERGAKATIPPRKGSRIRQHGNTAKATLPRDEILRAIRKMGKAAWKKTSGYHRRSIAENVMYRLKTLFGDSLSNRLFEHQATEAFIRCSVLNKMTHLGMPKSYMVND